MIVKAINNRDSESSGLLESISSAGCGQQQTFLRHLILADGFQELNRIVTIIDANHIKPVDVL